MNEPTTITQEALFDARVLFAGQLDDCPHCGGFSRPDPRNAPTRHAPVICLAEPRDAWFVRCFSCFACVTSIESALEAVERWNRRTGAAARRPELLPLVSLRRAAEVTGLAFTPAAEAFARQVQTDVLRLNRRPL